MSIGLPMMPLKNRSVACVDGNDFIKQLGDEPARIEGMMRTLGNGMQTLGIGDSYDDALAESNIGLYKTEVIRRLGPWRHAEAVEHATLRWVHRFNT